MDIYTLILSDHEEARALTGQIESLTPAQHAQRRALFEQLKGAISLHNDAEADSFYIALAAHPATRAIARRSHMEHIEAAEMMTALSYSNLPATGWAKMFATLRDALLQHMDEEEGMVFDAARSVISQTMADELGIAMQGIKRIRQDLLRKAG